MIVILPPLSFILSILTLRGLVKAVRSRAKPVLDGWRRVHNHWMSVQGFDCSLTVLLAVTNTPLVKSSNGSGSLPPVSAVKLTALLIPKQTVFCKVCLKLPHELATSATPLASVRHATVFRIVVVVKIVATCCLPVFLDLAGSLPGRAQA